ncbi:MAG: phosphoribosyltransferase [Ilumatobacteraceae bacterium]
MRFTDRRDAGRRLAGLLQHLVGDDVAVLGLPRGGVPVAFEVADALSAPLDVIVVRKLGAPYQPELAMGAIGEGGVRLIDDRVVRSVGATDTQIARTEERERAELARRAEQFRGDAPPIAIEGKTAVIVDDGIATGSSARVACRIVRARQAARIVLAVPVAPDRWTSELRDEADEFVCVHTPRWYRSVGEWYDDFRQTTDDEVVRCLELARR